MQLTSHDAPSTVSDQKLKVFVSYARRDQAFAIRLVGALEMRGLAARIDTRDLPDLEDWRRELLGFIQRADAVVFVVSPASVASQVCHWEIERVAEFGKRLAPVVLERVPDDKIPPAAAKINYLFFDDASTFDTQCDSLAAALQLDMRWVKEHTRLGELARRWSDLGRPAHLVLRGSEIKLAEAWLLSRPRNAPEPTPLHQDYVLASRQNETRRQRRTVWMSVSAAVIALGLMGAAIVQGRIAERNRAQAERNLDTAIDTTEKFVTALASDLKNIQGLPPSKISDILDAAKAQFDRIAESAPDNPKLLKNRASLYLVYAETYEDIGKPQRARERAREAEQIAERLAAAAPQDASIARLQRVAANRVAIIEGRPTVTATSLERTRAAARANPDSPDFQRDLVVDLNALGDRQRQTGDTASALKSYSEALDIVTSLIGRNGDQVFVKSDLAISYSRLGNLYSEVKDQQRENEYYEKALLVSEQIAKEEPWNTEWQRNLAIAHEKVGLAKLRSGEPQLALEHQRTALSLRSAMLATDPKSVIWQTQIAAGLSMLANTYLALKDVTQARVAEEQSLAMIRKIVELEGTPSPERRRLLQYGLNRVAGFQLDAGESSAALSNRREALDIARQLDAADPENIKNKSDMFVGLTNVAALSTDRREAMSLLAEARQFLTRLVAIGQPPPAMGAAMQYALANAARLSFLDREFADAVELSRQLVAQDPSNARYDAMLAGSLLFAGQTNEAEQLYLKHRGSKVAGQPWGEMIARAFADARAKGFEHPKMAEIELKLKE